MEKLNIAYRKHLRKQIARTGAACALGIFLPQIAPVTYAQESLVQKELSRRLDNARKANELLLVGDKAYNQQDYKTAVSHYAQAFDLLPGGSMTLELRDAAAERYATAATERARQLAKGGKYDEAKQLLSQVLKPDIAPAHLGALKLSGQIDDPVRYNPALTGDHVQNVQKVGMALREAEGYYNLGQYDRALSVYQETLRLDPYNKAARRGMERIHATKSDYYRASYDNTRAELLGAIDKGWELAVPPEVDATLLQGQSLDSTFAASLREKLAAITIEVVDLDQASLEEALDFVRVQSQNSDIPSISGEKNGINIVLTLGSPEAEITKAIRASRVDLKARDLPLSKVLDYITDQTHTHWRSDGAAILVTPLGSSDDTIISRTFRVPPNFLTSTSAQKTESSDDIFDSGSSNSEGLLPTKISITDFLKQSGITFPEGASANYTAASNSLTVRNSAYNIELVDQLVSAISNEEPVQVIIRTTIRRVSEKKLKALSFDWMISPALLGNNTFLGGGTVGNGTALNDMPLAPFSGLGDPITSGLRSGATGLHNNSLDTFINSNTNFGSTEIRSPGILTLTGVYSGIQIQMMMRGMDQKTGADVLQKPSTISRSGERSKIEVLREFIYPTEYEPPEIANTSSSASSIDPITGEIITTGGSSPITPTHPTAFEMRKVGISLEVEPTVGPNKKFIELSLIPEMVEFEGFVNYGTPIMGSTGSTSTFSLDALGLPEILDTNAGDFGVLTENNILMPIFKVTRLKNQTITIQDGATIVLGGLMGSRKAKVEDKVPVLGDIPYVGRLFRSEAEQTLNEAIIITVQVELVDPAGVPWKGR